MENEQTKTGWLGLIRSFVIIFLIMAFTLYVIFGDLMLP